MYFVFSQFLLYVFIFFSFIEWFFILFSTHFAACRAAVFINHFAFFAFSVFVFVFRLSNFRTLALLGIESARGGGEWGKIT